MTSGARPGLRVLVIDGYTDEPAGLGVPPYIDVYPRYIAGAVWEYDHSSEVFYRTIDQARRNPEDIRKISSSSDLSVLIAGVTVPGRYLGGAPATARDATTLPNLLQSGLTAICGPAVRFGFARGGGSTSYVSKELLSAYDFAISGDPEAVIFDLLKSGLKDADLTSERECWGYVNRFATRGARIVQQHPGFPGGLICELETFRGCPRSVGGGCSFCTEPLHGPPNFRPSKGVAMEVSALATLGVENFRLGRQPDLLIYGSKDDGCSPAPNPASLERLLSSVRKSAPGLKVLHIDNINPSTIYCHPEASEAALKTIIKYHTPGDVAALGIESIDVGVIRKNNLKIDPDGAFFAISLINDVGGARGANGLPQLLPGINFVYGLPGETEATFDCNLEFMKNVLAQGLLVRRINLRQVMVLPSTRLESFGDNLVKKHHSLFVRHKMRMRAEIDEPMMKRVLPQWTVLKDVRTELADGRITWSRQMGSYPILVGMQSPLPIGQFYDAVVVSHGPRSVGALKIPLKINSLTLAELNAIPGIGAKRAAALLRSRPFQNIDGLRRSLDDPSLIEPLCSLIDFAPRSCLP
jgi:radical SAM superfamily enzyme with C-terminal helix-hairpin-helix motif